MTAYVAQDPIDVAALALSMREGLLARLQERPGVMPLAMRERKQWLLWRLQMVDGKPKPQKVPYWASGRKRGGSKGDPMPQGGEKDRAALVTYEVALDRLGKMKQMTGLGFAFLPDDGLVGIDIDHAIDPESGEVSNLCREVIERNASYCERSVSGKGIHVIVAGKSAKFKNDRIGLEVYCDSQYFTCSGHHWGGSPDDVQPLDPDAFAWMRELVDTANEEDRATRAEEKAAKAAAAAATAPPAAPAPAPASSGTRAGNRAAFAPGDDFQRVNSAAMNNLRAWVPVLFPKAVPHATINGDGYRVRSKDLGRDLEEDIGITPKGIKDFGTDEQCSPIDLFVKWDGRTLRDALHHLARLLGVTLPKRRPQLVKNDPGESPASSAPADGDGRPDAPPQDPPDGPAENSPPARGKGGASGIERLRESFALIYGTEAVWDGEQRRQMKIAALKLIFGNDDVKDWLRVKWQRRTVLPEHMVFEPGATVPSTHINLFDGFAVDPIDCEDEEVRPMLELLWHLCCKSAETKEGVRKVFRQVLAWLALPLQRPGEKSCFALLFHGPQGTGKNLFFDGVRAIYGKYGCMVGQTELEDKFNDWLSAKLMIIGNEVVTRQELYHHKNKLKWIITEPTIPIRGMMQSVRWESNHANLVFLSNEQQPLALEKDDRRYLVVYTPLARDDDLYRRVSEWLKKQDGSAKMMAYLMRVDLGEFDAHTKPMMTEAKESLIELGLKPSERFMNEWTGGLLELPMRPCSNTQLYRVFRKWCDMTGERFAPNQANFTIQCKRHIEERVEKDAEGKRIAAEPLLTYKVVALKFDQNSPRKAERCWLPRGTGAPDNLTEGEWVGECVREFEDWVISFGRTRSEASEGAA